MKKENMAIGDIKQQEIIESVTSLDLNAKGGISSRQSNRARILTKNSPLFLIQMSRQNYLNELQLHFT